MISLHPESWYLLIAIPFLLVLLFIGSRRGMEHLQRMGYPKGHPELRRYLLKRFYKALSFLFFYVLIVLALFDFHWGREPVSRDSRGLDMAIVMDLSYSMLAVDSLPSRLDAGKENALLMLQNLENTRVSFIPFKGEPMTAVPLTEDRVMLEHFIQIAEPNWLSSPGSNIEKALLKAEETLNSDQDRNRMILLITDGEELSGSALRAARKLMNQGLSLVVLAVGSTTPVKVETAPGEWLSTASGSPVLTSQNLEMLQELVRIMDGTLLQANQQSSQNDLMDKLSELTGRGLGISYVRQQKYGLFLFPAIMMLLINQWIGRVSWRRKS